MLVSSFSCAVSFVFGRWCHDKLFPVGEEPELEMIPILWCSNLEPERSPADGNSRIDEFSEGGHMADRFDYLWCRRLLPELGAE